MKIIKILVNKIEEEIHDAEDYAKLSMQYKEDYPDTSATFLTLSRQELDHVNMLHQRIKELIIDYRNEHGDPPESMMAIWDWEHEKLIDGVSRIKTMHDMAR